MQIALFLIMLVVGLGLGFAFAILYTRGVGKGKESELALLQNKLENAERENADLKSRLSESVAQVNSKQNEITMLHSQLARLEERIHAEENKLKNERETFSALSEASKAQFAELAEKILEEKSARFTEKNRENIDQVLKPLSEGLANFKKSVEDTYEKGTEQRNKLEERIKILVEKTTEVSNQANNLASALKGGTKKQGDWGEMILESVLERSGLVRGREYEMQASIKSGGEDGSKNLRPDALIFLPNNRTIIVDSKVSLTAYDRYYAAENAVEQSTALQDHLQSVKKHVDELAAKKYEDIVSNSPDFTMMFVPIEPAYLLAIQNDQDLWNYAYKKHILLISPTNLIACLKLIADLWRHEAQSQNAKLIAEQGARLYEKFAGFVATFEDIGETLDKAKKSFDKASGQLKLGRGNLISQAEKLKSLGIKTDKALPETID